MLYGLKPALLIYLLSQFLYSIYGTLEFDVLRRSSWSALLAYR
jgi:hypothetical protein